MTRKVIEALFRPVFDQAYQSRAKLYARMETDNPPTDEEWEAVNEKIRITTEDKNFFLETLDKSIPL